MSGPRQMDFAAALLDPALPSPAGLRAWNGSDPTARFAVYRNNVVSSLIDALAETFPVAQALVGEEFFRAMASVFVRSHPPKSRLLAFYGNDFPSFIEAFEPAQTLPYLADVARLEMARVRAYHAMDAEPVAPALVQAALSRPDQLPDLRLRLHPSTQVIESSHAVVSIWAAHQDEAGLDLGAVDVAQPEQALILRPALDVIVIRLDPGGASLCDALQGGMPLGEAAAIAMQRHPGFNLPATLSALLVHGAVSSIDFADEA